MINRRTLLATGAGLGLALAGCGRGSGQTKDTARDVASGPASGAIQVWAMGKAAEKLSTLSAQFTAANPGTKVEVTAVPWKGAHDKISAAVAARTTPDLCVVGTTWMAEFAKTGALDPAPPNLFDQSDFVPAAWDSVVVGGTAYGVPWYVDTHVLFYRTDLVSAPPADWKALHALGKAGSKWGIGLDLTPQGIWKTILPMIWQHGGDIFDGKAFHFDTPEVRAALETYGSLFADGLAPRDLPATDLERAFVTGEVGMILSGPWQLANLVTVAGSADINAKYKVAQVPQGTSFVGGGDLVVFKDAKNRDSAWRFVKWLSTPAIQTAWQQVQGELPSTNAAWEQPPLSKEERLQVFGKQMRKAKAPPVIPTWDQLAMAIGTEAEKIARGVATPADAAKALQAKADALGTGS